MSGMGVFGTGGSRAAAENAGNRRALKDQATRARAKDVRARGGNPVTVADLRQRGATNTGHSGRPVGSRWLSWLG